NSREFFDIGSTTPIAAVSLLDEKSWALETKQEAKTGVITSAGEFTDVFFGIPLHHVPVALLIYTSFIVWFLVPVVRNIKRDPAVYAAFTPIQMLGLLFYFNFLLIGFYRWKGSSPYGFAGPKSPLDIQTMFLGMNFAMFLATGFVLIRNRDHVRRRIRELGDAATNLLSALWPGTYVAVGVLLVGLAVIGMAQLHYSESEHWGITFALFRLVFIAVWLARDLLYLQWMNLRIGKRPLAMGMLFLIVFYTCVSILFATFDMFDTPEKQIWTAVALPIPFFTSTLDSWTLHEARWLGMLAAQLAQVGLFAYLHRQKLLELAPLAAPAAAPPPAPAAPSAPVTGNALGIGS
ncbi:MAG TPA: hypothetical protein VNL38_02845, partial [Candidatus Nitrosotenuis sp.]|nr:hypothetical protein [Candidatus Nitrosotenuis sp.]